MVDKIWLFAFGILIIVLIGIQYTLISIVKYLQEVLKYLKKL